MAILSDFDILRRENDGQDLVLSFLPEKVELLFGERCLSYGLSCAGYDIRLSEDVRQVQPLSQFYPMAPKNLTGARVPIARHMDGPREYATLKPGEFLLGVSVERFKIPTDLVASCTGKSTYARMGVGVYVTPLEPGWEGYLTLEIANHGKHPVALWINEGIAQIQFHELSSPSATPYAGKYQNQDAEVTLPRL